jgi:exodeoxyribonuclease VII large subunit
MREGNQLNIPLFTVSQYNEYINELVMIEPVLVEGEVSNYRAIPGRNFCYFDIKDDLCVAKCFQGFWNSKKIELQNGAKVKILGYPAMQKNGTFVIDVREILLSGKGALMEAYLKLKQRLEAEGLFEQSFKKEIPRFPKRIGLIAGKNSSAYYDVTAEIRERWRGVEVLFCASKVQGIYAKGEIVKAVQVFNTNYPVDVLIIARGGGSMEDLQAFDSEEVVRVIFASKIPIISAIGHEDHWTLADFVADVRAKTPTKAAQIAVPDIEEIKERLWNFAQQGKTALLHVFLQKNKDLRFFFTRMKNSMQTRIGKEKEQVLHTISALEQSLLKELIRKNERLMQAGKLLEILNPQAILQRGYAVVEKKGVKIKSVNEVGRLDEVVVTLSDGYFDARVEKKFKRGSF